MDKQVDKNYYYTEKYANLERFISYFYQIDLIRKTKAEKILFIGIGDGLVVNYLKKNNNLDIITLDIAQDLNPDIVADIKEFNSAEKYDLVVAFEVLEHLLFEDFDVILKKLKKLSDRVLISLPYRNSSLELVIKFPFIRTLFKKDYFRILIPIPIKFPGFQISGQHYWEIDSQKYKMKKIKNIINKYFDIQCFKRALLTPYKCFFVLESKNK